MDVGNIDEVNSLAFSPDGKYIISGNYPSVKVWNVQTGQIIRTLNCNNIFFQKIMVIP